MNNSKLALITAYLELRRLRLEAALILWSKEIREDPSVYHQIQEGFRKWA